MGLRAIAGARARRLAVACLWAAMAHANAAAMDLMQAWQAAVLHDPQLRAARAGAAATRERVPQAEAQLRPQVGATFNHSRNDLRQQTPGPGGARLQQHLFYGSASDALTISQPLYRPELTAQLREARALAAGGDAVLEQEEQKLVMRVTQAYLEALQAQEQWELVQSQRTAFTTQLDAARKGFAAGSGIRTDIDEAQARLDLNIAQELEARQGVDYTRRQLSLIVGMPVAELAPVDPLRLPPAPAQPAGLDDWIAHAEDASPEIRGAKLQVDAARSQVERMRAAHLPTLDAVAQLSHGDSDNPTRVSTSYNQASLGLQLTVPLYRGGLVDSQVREALAQVDQRESQLDALRFDLASRVHREFRGVTEGLAKMRALEQAVRSSAQLVTSSRRSQQAGSRTIIDVLNAEQQLGLARRDLALARFSYLLAIVRLRALAGEMREASIAEANGWLTPQGR